MINYKIPQMKPGGNGSSEVWTFISKQIQRRGYKVNIHPNILINHLGYEKSKMHPKFRKHIPIIIKMNIK